MLKNVLHPSHVKVHCVVQSKKCLFEAISNLAIKPYCGLNPTMIMDGLLGRERIGSTYLDKGIAIPHARFTLLQQPIALCLRLDAPLDYDDTENHPVDLCLALLLPNDDSNQYLKLLSHCIRCFKNAAHLNKIREAPNDKALYQCLIDEHALHSHEQAANFTV
jgi:PTS system nitrogen regulatory IIA component